MWNIFCLTFVASFFVFMLGCDEDISSEVGPPEVLNVSVGGRLPPGWSSGLSEGSAIFSGSGEIIATFSKEMEWVEIDISCAMGATTLEPNGKKAVWKHASIKYGDLGFDTSDIEILEWWLSKSVPPDFAETWILGLYIPPGEHTLTINGADKSGQELEGFNPINFTVFGPDMDPPMIDDDRCDPKNGAENVDPQEYMERIAVTFDEAMSRANVFATDPGFPFNEEISADGKSLIISFSDEYSMPYNTEFTIKSTGVDMAGTQLSLIRYDIKHCEPERAIYSFTTMPKEER